MVSEPSRRGQSMEGRGRTATHAYRWKVCLREAQQFYGKILEEMQTWCLLWLMAPELGIGPFSVDASQEPAMLPDAAPPPRPVLGPQPFALGDRVFVIANEHDERETLNLVGRTGTVRQVYPDPTTIVMECGELLDGEDRPRLFPPSVLSRLDPEVDDGDDD